VADHNLIIAQGEDDRCDGCATPDQRLRRAVGTPYGQCRRKERQDCREGDFAIIEIFGRKWMQGEQRGEGERFRLLQIIKDRRRKYESGDDEERNSQTDRCRHRLDRQEADLRL
jgi:hypothetical protein